MKRRKLMTAIADIELPVSDTGLGTVFDAVPSLTCEVEQVIASSNRTLWLSGEHRPALEFALDESPAIAQYTCVGDGDGRWLYDIEFTDEIVDVFGLVRSEDGTILSAKAAEGSWRLRIRFPEREHVSALYDRLRTEEIPLTIHRLSETPIQQGTGCGLTEQQYETLVAAIDRGYFEIPRRVSMQELADELEVSHQALSERLRRAYQTLVTSEFEDGRPDGETPSLPLH